jgi:ATP-dependent RNA circularization protein (DNA/RNA ligase family)
MEPSFLKYPRTWHLPWSPGLHDDDKALKNCAQFEFKQVVITKKMDGENTTAYSNGHVHARSIDSRGGEDRAWVKRFLTEQVCFNLPEGWRICGENLWAEHSIHYSELSSYFYGFSLWNELNECLSWDETIEYFELLSVTPVEVLYTGIWDEKKVRALCESLDTNTEEGLVVRVADGFKYKDFHKSVAKYVRANHVQTASHWRHVTLTQNKLAHDI